MKNLMLDLETLGTTKDCVIVQIGACYFDIMTGSVGDKFKININIKDSINKGFSVNGDTIGWWLAQSNEAQQSILADKRVSVEDALNLFSEFASRAKAVWSHATFDVPILASAYDHMNMKIPFRYTSARDIRTIVDLSSLRVKDLIKKFPREGTHHDALDDCVYQVQYLTYCMREIKKNQWGIKE